MNTNKTHSFLIRLSDDDLAMFKVKAARHQSMSAMIRAAVAQYDDRATRGKLETLTKMMSFYKKYQQELALVGSNLNQAVKRAHQLAIDQQLNFQFFENTLFPTIKKVDTVISTIRKELKSITNNLLSLL